jgi:hypothetical protein
MIVREVGRPGDQAATWIAGCLTLSTIMGGFC